MQLQSQTRGLAGGPGALGCGARGVGGRGEGGGGAGRHSQPGVGGVASAEPEPALV